MDVEKFCDIFSGAGSGDFLRGNDGN